MMRRILACIFALMLAVSAAAAEKRETPEDKKEIITQDIPGHETRFRQYDSKFWEAPSDQPGTVVELSYTTSVYGNAAGNTVKVYLPYGYAENTQAR